jgi:ubiquinone/menaquinone biosynthesis C-methylase UbiE
MPNTVKKISRRVRDKLRVVRTRLGLRKESPKAPPPPTDHESGRSLYNTVGFLDATAAGWFQTKTRELFRDFPINDTDTVLDVGCGLGYNLKFCAQYAAKSIGIDIDPTRVKATDDLLRNSGIKNFKVITSDGNPLPLDSASVDKIVCTEVLEHVDDPMVSMRELVRVGKPGALYMLSAPGQLSEEILKVVAPRSCFEKPNHIRIFSSESLRKLVEDSGLIIEHHHFYGFYWTIWHALLWMGKVNYEEGTHPALDHWARAWKEALSMPDAKNGLEELDRVLHKIQIIIARKPL